MLSLVFEASCSRQTRRACADATLVIIGTTEMQQLRVRDALQVCSQPVRSPPPEPGASVLAPPEPAEQLWRGAPDL